MKRKKNPKREEKKTCKSFWVHTCSFHPLCYHIFWMSPHQKKKKKKKIKCCNDSKKNPQLEIEWFFFFGDKFSIWFCMKYEASTKSKYFSTEIVWKASTSYEDFYIVIYHHTANIWNAYISFTSSDWAFSFNLTEINYPKYSLLSIASMWHVFFFCGRSFATKQTLKMSIVFSPI